MGYFNILRLYAYNNKQFASQKNDTFTFPHISLPKAKYLPIYILMQLNQKTLQDHLGKNSTRWMVAAVLETQFSWVFSSLF